MVLKGLPATAASFKRRSVYIFESTCLDEPPNRRSDEPVTESNGRGSMPGWLFEGAVGKGANCPSSVTR